MDSKYYILGILLIVAVGFLLHYYHKHFKTPHLSAVNLITGAVKSGKSYTSVALSIKEIKSRQRRTKIYNKLMGLFGKEPIEMPLLYSNIPLGCDYVPITRELLLRETRFRYGSVVYLDEVSFVADKMLYKKDEVLLDDCKGFFKLFGHETQGGVLIANTQTISDCSKEFRACISSNIFIDCVSKPFYLPFFSIVNGREERYSEDGTIVNSYNEDIDQSMVKFLIRTSVCKMYDKYCFSILTDDLDVEDHIIKGKYLPHLKTSSIVSFDKQKDLRPRAQKLEVENDKEKV